MARTTWTVAGLIAAGVLGMFGAWLWRVRASGHERAAAATDPIATTSKGVTAETDDGGEITLPEAERGYIWEIEHRVLVLDFRFWSGLSAAIRDGDVERIRGYFTDDAAVELLGQDSNESEADRLDLGVIQSVSVDTRGNRPGSVGELVDDILKNASKFSSNRSVSIRTVFLSPSERDQFAGPWSGRLMLRVWGEDEGKRPTEWVMEADFELATLVDEVPTPARWIAYVRARTESFRQADRWLFTERGSSWGLDASRFHDNWLLPGSTARVMTGGIYMADYDLDGMSDMLVTDIKGNVLYRQAGLGKFHDTTWMAGLENLAPGAAVAWADLNGDAFPDLIVENELFGNTGRGTFERVGALNVRNVNRIHGFAIADYDRDGLLDIYVARLAPDPLEGAGKASWLDDRTGPGNTLLHNLGDWRFEDVTARAGASAGTVSCLSAAWMDANDDLWPDLFVGDEFGSPVLLVNRQDGTFESRTITGDFGGFNMGVATGDLDNDGRVDLYLANMYSKAGERVLSNLNLSLYPADLARRIRHIVDGSELWHNSGDLQFESSGRASGVARVGWSYGPRIADFDNDGMLDIYAPAGFLSVSRDEPDG